MVTRAQVVLEALTWLMTPYHKGGRLKGIGVDCGTLLFCVYQNCGLVAPGSEGIFGDERAVPVGQDWFCHTTEEKYMFLLMRHAHRVAEATGYASLKALPGNLVITKAVGSRVYNHGGIVTKWPRVIHAREFVQEIDASRDHMWAGQIVSVFDPWVKAEAECSTKAILK